MKYSELEQYIEQIRLNYFNNSSNFTHAHLSNNQLDSLPESIGNLSFLTNLYLNHNQLTSLPESIGDLHHLDRLDLQANHIKSPR
jgi:Leucine-rich repeat (LRR) protein